jgi:hypothetical protein
MRFSSKQNLRCEITFTHRFSAIIGEVGHELARGGHRGSSDVATVECVPRVSHFQQRGHEDVGAEQVLVVHLPSAGPSDIR